MSSAHVHLKCSLSPTQIEDRLRHHPSILELQLFEHDLATPDRIVETIKALHSQQIRVYLHHPMTFQGRFLDIMSSDPVITTYYETSSFLLDEICQRYDLLCVVHPHYSKCESGRLNLTDRDELAARSIALAEALGQLARRLSGRFLWENAPCGLFSTQNPYWIDAIVEPLKLPVCYDISHAFMGLRGENAATRLDMIKAFPHTQYYHVVDSVGGERHDALPLGEGLIDWVDLKPFILQRDFIFEIDLKDYNDCTPMMRSQAYFDALPISKSAR